VSARLRPDVVAARRVVVKVGSSSLAAAGAIDDAALSRLVDVLSARRAEGVELCLVSSGAIATGLQPLGVRGRPRDLATLQAAASVGQGTLIHHYTRAFARHGLVVGQVLLTADDVVRRSHYRNAQRTLYRLLEMGAFPVVNENDTVATDEIRFGDNDRLAALVAHLIHADLLVLLSDVDGLYDGNPRRAGATLISQVRGEEDLANVHLGRPGGAGVGTGGMQTKVEAARIATGAGVPVVLTSATHARDALAGVPVGTHFSVTGRRIPTRLLWLAHATTGRGRLVLDAGAVSAVVGRRASLLPAGIVAVSGQFDAGDPVDLVDPADLLVARGITAFGSEELPDLIGRSTKDLAKQFGSAYEREVVHRDALVLLPAAGKD
jgi:glutamate 5-kinase